MVRLLENVTAVFRRLAHSIWVLCADGSGTHGADRSLRACCRASLSAPSRAKPPPAAEPDAAHRDDGATTPESAAILRRWLEQSLKLWAT